MTDPEECVQTIVEIAWTRDGKFVGVAMPLGALDLPFVVPSTNAILIERRRTQNALYIKVTGGDVP